jgi:hypothetical protein
LSLQVNKVLESEQPAFLESWNHQLRNDARCRPISTVFLIVASIVYGYKKLEEQHTHTSLNEIDVTREQLVSNKVEELQIYDQV